jgi:hypothetical protein
MTGLRAGRHATLRLSGEPRRGLARRAAPTRKVALHLRPPAARIAADLRLAHRLPPLLHHWPMVRRAIHV